MMVVCVWKWSKSNLVRSLAIGIFLLVCLQGVLGGLRVTEINTWFGVIHGVIGQLIFASFVCLAAPFSPLWKSPSQSTNRGDGKWAFALCLAMLLQLVLGAIYRHMIGDEALAPKATHILYTHIAVAFLVLVIAIVLGVRCMHRDNAFLKKLGITLHALVLLQLLLGGGALVVILINEDATHPLYEVLVTTAHQANGALLLGASFATFVWVNHVKRV
jgi:heme A synthase